MKVAVIGSRDLCQKQPFQNSCFFSKISAPYFLQKSPLTFYTMRYIVLCKGRYMMDVQLKRGLLDICVLAAIKNEDSYGYQILKDLKPYVELSESTLYPILRRLETAACLTVQAAEHNGRLRKYYHITPLGLKRIEDFQEEWKEIISIYQFIVREEQNCE